MGVLSLEMTFLMVFPLLWTIFCFTLASRNILPPWPEKNFSHLALHNSRANFDPLARSSTRALFSSVNQACVEVERRHRMRHIHLPLLALVGLLLLSGCGSGTNSPAISTAPSCSSAPSREANSHAQTVHAKISEFAIPALKSGPRDIAAGPDGALWFTQYGSNQIGRITANGSITEYTVPTLDSSPAAITAGPDGALWFTELQVNKIGRITANGSITEFAVHTSEEGIPISLLGITAGPDGALWFTENSSNKIGRITANGSITEYTVPTLGGYPNKITAAPNGTLWFT